MNALRRLKHRLRLRVDTTVGRVTAAGRKLAETIDWQDWRADRATVLCLRRSTFVKDVDEMRRHGTYNWAKVSAARIKRIQEKWVAPELRLQTYFHRVLENELKRDRAHLELFAMSFLEAACRQHPIDAVLAGNTDYWQDESIKIACRNLGIPFLVLGRENYSMEIDAINVAKRFRESKFRFNGAGVAVYSRATQQVMIDSGAFPAGSVWVTGAPRLDYWLKVRPLPAEQRRKIVLLNYADPAGYLAPENFKQVARAFIAAARSAPGNVKFALKSKKLNEEEFTRQLIPEFNDAPIEFISTQPLHELYPECRAVIGLNSLAVVEGFLSELAVVVPNWGDAKRDPIECMLDPGDAQDTAVAYFADTAQELDQMLQACVNDRLPPRGAPEDRRRRFCKHIALPDTGTCTDQVEAFIRHYMDAAGTGRAGR